MAWTVVLAVMDLPAVADERLDRVKGGWAESRAAVRTVQCTFVYTLQGQPSDAHYTRDGQKLAVASADGSVVKTVWNGKEARYRSGPGSTLIVSGDRNDFTPGFSLPEEKFGGIAARAIGLEPPLDDSSRPVLQSSAEETLIEKACIRLTYLLQPTRRGQEQYTLIVRHSPADGYWPVRAALHDSAGRLIQEQRSSFHHARVEGIDLVYPHTSQTRTYVTDDPTAQGNEISMTIDLDSLVLNGEVPLERFRLEPWPNEPVWNKITGQQIPAADPEWDFPNGVPEPWKKAVEANRARKARPFVPPRPGQPILALPGTETRTTGVINTWTLSGLALLTGAGGWVVYQRRRAT